MDPISISHLKNLQSSFRQLLAATNLDPRLIATIRVSAALVERLLTERGPARELRNRWREAVGALLPQLRALIDTTAVDLLQRALEGADDDAFGRALARVQVQLLDLQSGAAAAMSARLAHLEADYARGFVAALQAATAASEADGSSGARNARAYDESRLLDFIRRSFPQETALVICSSRYVPGGYSKYTLAIELENARELPSQIILRGDAGATFGGASVAAEYQIIETLYREGVTVPRPLALDPSGEAFGSPFMLVARLPGSPIGHSYDLPPPNAAICRDVAQQLAALHRVPVAAFGEVAGVNRRPSEVVAEWIDESERNWRALDLPSTVFPAAFSRLRRDLAFCDETPRTLVHGDYALNNLLIEHDRVTAILDWEFGHIGNPAYDLAYFCQQAERLSSWDEFLAAYTEAGAPLPSARVLDYYRLLAPVRIGVMVCQAAASFTAGLDAGPSVAAVVGRGWYEETLARIAQALARLP